MCNAKTFRVQIADTQLCHFMAKLSSVNNTTATANLELGKQKTNKKGNSPTKTIFALFITEK